MLEQMLIEKQEGEVKVHVTLGKAEKIASSVSSTGRIKLHDEMDIMKDAFEELVNKLHSVRHVFQTENAVVYAFLVALN